MTEEKEKKLEDIRKEAEEKKCPVNKALYYITEFLAGPMCGRCFPCMMGSYEAKIRLQNLVQGIGKEADLIAIKRIADDMLESSMCKKGKDTAKFINEWMATDVYKEHAAGRCPDMECTAYIEYRIIPDKCTMCGECQVVCKDNAIMGEKKKPYLSGYAPFEIRQQRCTKCGECIKVCPTKAIIVVSSKERELIEII
ncbi:MAG: 4Fe-4S binding protein [Nitrospirae bacterium]|nr:4Fe-4S binding protein [Nitrospirota bacterium]